jgi:hypothetical protein
MFFDFPTKEEWASLEAAYPFSNLKVTEDHFRYTAHAEGTLERFSAIPQLLTWIVHLQNRLIQTRWNYVLLMFHFEKGIPDEEWFISPGREGASVEYFPHFEMKHRLAKAQFDYYADNFYYKLFSAWDTLGHILNVMYELEIERPSFDKALRALELVRPALHASLKAIVDVHDFVKMRETRHNITHNLLPGHVGSSITKTSPDEFSIGVGSYTPSAVVKENVVASLDLFAQTLNAIKAQSVSDAS